MRLAFVVLLGAIVLLPALSGCFFRAAPSPAIFLKDDVYTKMVVEIDYQQGKAPRAEAVNLLKQRIEERCHKPDGVTIEQNAIADSDSVWTNGELQQLEGRRRDRDTGGDTATLYIVYLGGGHEKDTQNSRVLGVRFGRSAVAIFKDNIGSAASPLIPISFTAADVERSVLVHEFGHVLGLVNLETPMVRDHEDDDPQHKGHSDNKDSVMYWAVESSLINQVFTGPPPTQFDSNDVADLRAAGGK